MFFHIYRYRILCNIRNTSNLFWILVFPIVLATLFQFSLGGLMSGTYFAEIPIAVVDAKQWETQPYLVEALNAVSTGEEPLFNTQYVSLAKAQQLLEDDLIEGYLEMADEPRLVVKKSGVSQSIMKSFFDQVSMMTQTANAIIGQNPAVLNQGFIEALSDNRSYVQQVASQNNPNFTVLYFYTIFAMTCFYASFMGIEEVRVIQANQSAQAARIGISPTHKGKSYLAGLCAAMTIQLFVLSLLFVYVRYGLMVSFAEKILPIAFTCFLGSVSGLLFGSMLAAVVKTKPGTIETISAAITMFLCFLSGMMNAQIKYVLENKLPLLRYINPVNLISDSLYALYYFDTMDRYWINMAYLSILSLAFGIIALFVLRRQRYASI